MSGQRWWHCYGGPTDNGICTVIFGEASSTPEEARASLAEMHTSFGDVVPYLASFDHDPTDDERAEIDRLAEP